MQTRKEALLSAYRGEMPDYIPAEPLTAVDVVFPGDRYFGENREGEDGFGVRWTQLGPNPALDGNTVTPGYQRLSNIANWKEEVTFPPLDHMPLDQIIGGMFAGMGVDRKNTVVRGLFLSGTFERMNQLLGMENALCAFYEDPDSVHEFFHAMADYKIKCIDKMCEILDPDVIHLHDDWGTGANLFMSPDMWREFIKPHEKRYADHIHSKGKIYEHHSCGYITSIVGDLVEIGLDAINPLNVVNDLDFIKKNYGDKITMVGGIDNQKIDTDFSTEEEIRTEVRRAMDAYSKGGRYIPGFIYTKRRVLDIVTSEIELYGKNIYSGI